MGWRRGLFNLYETAAPRIIKTPHPIKDFAF
jgi:hypothetical protein